MNNIYERLVAYFGTQAKAADALGVDQASVSNWVRGKNGMSPLVAMKAERLTGGVLLAKHLCPRVFGHEKHRA